jgi:cell division initiation protein
MDKNAEFIRKKEFHIVFKGYKPEEVDKFLDIVSVEFDRLIRKNKELQESLDKIKFESSGEETDIKKIIQDALVSAHKVAEEIKSQAKKEAEEIIEKQKSEEERSLSDAQIKKLQLEESMIVLQSKYEELKGKIKRMLEDVNQFMEKVEKEDSQIPESAAEENFSQKKNVFTPEPVVSEFSKPAPVDTAESKINKISYFNGFSFEQKNKKETFSDKSDIENDIKNDIKNETVPLKEEDSNSVSEEKETAKKENPETENQQDPGLKRQRKKIDIANPDIIENFFRTDEDKNY